MSTLGIILSIFLFVLLFGGGFTSYRGGPYLGTGPWGGGLLAILVLVVIVLALTGRL